MGRPRCRRFRAKEAARLPAGLEQDPEGMEALGGDCPFIMIADGKDSLFNPIGNEGRAGAGAL